MEEDNWSLRRPEVQLTIELENMGEDNWSLRSPEVQLTIKLESWYKTTAVFEAWSTTAIKLDSLSFLMDTSYCKEQPKKQEDVARKKEMKE
jgi:hypothetical protein